MTLMPASAVKAASGVRASLELVIPQGDLLRSAVDAKKSLFFGVDRNSLVLEQFDVAIVASLTMFGRAM